MDVFLERGNMTERIQKILASRGVASRRGAEELIAAGRVTCNGVTVSLGERADPDRDRILVDGVSIPRQDKPVYIMLHKPRGYVTTLSDEKGRPDAARLVADCGVRVHPVGRLDMDSEGLLLFTNDGSLTYRLTHPSHEVEKVYDVLVHGYTPEAEELLRRPIVLDGYRIRPPKVKLARIQGENARILVVIHEGRNRQVRRMCREAGMQVLRLRRIAEGSLRLGDLPEGSWRYLTEAEIEALKKM